jgi:hypothetical protein
VTQKVVTLPSNSASLSSSLGFVKQLLPLLNSCSVFVCLIKLLNELTHIKDTVVRFPGVVGIVVTFPFNVEGKLFVTNQQLEYFLDNILDKVVDNDWRLRNREYLQRKEWHNVWLEELLITHVIDLLLLPHFGDLDLVCPSANAFDNFEWSKAKIFELLQWLFGGQVSTVQPNELALFIHFVITYMLVVLLLHTSLSI